MKLNSTTSSTNKCRLKLSAKKFAIQDLRYPIGSRRLRFLSPASENGEMLFGGLKKAEFTRRGKGLSEPNDIRKHPAKVTGSVRRRITVVHAPTFPAPCIHRENRSEHCMPNIPAYEQGRVAEDKRRWAIHFHRGMQPERPAVVRFPFAQFNSLHSAQDQFGPRLTNA